MTLLWLSRFDVSVKESRNTVKEKPGPVVGLESYSPIRDVTTTDRIGLNTSSVLCNGPKTHLLSYLYLRFTY